MILSPATISPGLQGILTRLKKKDPRTPNNPTSNMHALSRPRILTLAFGEEETVRMLPQTYEDLEALARDWVKPAPDATFTLRIPTEYASPLASRFINGPYIWISSEEAFQLATHNVSGVRMEIVSDAPPPPPNEEPPAPPVLEMDGTFNLELMPGRHAALDVLLTSDELDMSKLEDGTMVVGHFVGKLDIIHDGDEHRMEFTGTRTQQDYPDLVVDTRVMTKLRDAARPATAKCRLSIFPPQQQYVDIALSLAPLWRIGTTFPEAEPQEGNRVKWFVRVNPGSAIEHFNTETACSSLYYEALPDPSSLDPASYIAPHNGYGMPTRVFIPHLMQVLDRLGLNLNARTTFVQSNMSSFLMHENIAYRFMSPGRLASAVDISIDHDPCLWSRIFLMWRGISDEELVHFQTLGASDKEALIYNWREHIGWSEAHDDKSRFRVIETSILEVT